MLGLIIIPTCKIRVVIDVLLQLHHLCLAEQGISKSWFEPDSSRTVALTRTIKAADHCNQAWCSIIFQDEK